MADVALTNIKHGKADGSTVQFEPGEAVSGLSDDEMKALKDSGAVGDIKALDASDPRNAQIAALEAEVARLKAEKEAALAPVSSTEAPAESAPNIATGAGMAKETATTASTTTASKK